MTPRYKDTARTAWVCEEDAGWYWWVLGENAMSANRGFPSRADAIANARSKGFRPCIFRADWDDSNLTAGDLSHIMGRVQAGQLEHLEKRIVIKALEGVTRLETQVKAMRENASRSFGRRV